jgi:hypothetical protein
MTYVMSITLVTPPLHSQLVLRERLQSQTWFHGASMQRATAFLALLPVALPLFKPTLRTRPGQPEADAGFTPSLPMTSQTLSQTLFHLYKAQRLTAFPTLPAASILTQPTTRTQPWQSEAETSFVHKAQHPIDLSSGLPSALSVASPEQRQEAAGLFASPTGRQSVPTISQVPDIDMNRLTDHVYQALERKIRLEKQRRGYR